MTKGEGGDFGGCPRVFRVDKASREELGKAIGEMVETCKSDEILHHSDASLIPSRSEVVEILRDLEGILFPGFFGKQELDGSYLQFHLGNEMHLVYEKLGYQITKALAYSCRSARGACSDCDEAGQSQALEFMRRLPRIRKMLSGDVRAAYKNDPAAKSHDEVVISYPAVRAITYYRVAHELFTMGVPIIPRIMTEHGHGETGIDIHPGAKIGENFFIDHGTGVVVGETTDIGRNVVLYQGVTLGALHFARDAKGELARGVKRHPTVEDNVTIYASATILGGDTVIGHDSVIGGNVWLVESVPPFSKIVTEYRQLKITSRKDAEKD
ncbi:MAG: serine O-acetyltransferase EpsC [Methanobacteriota archaeon]